MVGLLLKRTYLVFPSGRVSLAPHDHQEPLFDAEIPHAVSSPSQIAPIRAGNDALTFKAHTDVVIQASAYTYHPRVIETLVSVRFGGVKREIRVVGDRFGEWGPNGPSFSEPDPFLSLPIRLDRAYGGLDATALERDGLARIEAHAPVSSPVFSGRLTPFHYPRNPSGKGYLLHLDRSSFEALEIPNLEYPGDPMTPGRLVVDPSGDWRSAPVPAAMDWQPSFCYPRRADLENAPANDAPRPEYAQAAAPGLSVASLRPDEEFELVNLHPTAPVLRCSLPGEIPRVLLTLPEPGGQIALRPHLESVILRPDQHELVMVWLGSAPIEHRLPEHVLEQLAYRVSWHLG